MSRHNCYELIDEALTARGVRLSMLIQINPDTGQTISTPRILLTPLDDSRAAKRTARICNMLASNCPFCGVVLERLPDSPPADAAAAAREGP